MSDCNDTTKAEALKTACNNCVIPGTPLWSLLDGSDNCEVALFESLVVEFTDISGWAVK